MDNICRICRGEATPEEPLFHPCKCAGSIGYVHQDCLFDWLEHAGTGHRCELCNTSYQLQKRYKPDMPEVLPPSAYFRSIFHQFRTLLEFVYVCLRGIALVIAASIASEYEFDLLNCIMDQSWNDIYALLMFRRNDSSAAVGSINKSYFSWAAFDRGLSSTMIARFLADSFDGFILLLMGGFISFVVYVVCAWTLNDTTLQHDIEHIVNGQPGHMDCDLYEDKNSLAVTEEMPATGGLTDSRFVDVVLAQFGLQRDPNEMRNEFVQLLRYARDIIIGKDELPDSGGEPVKPEADERENSVNEAEIRAVLRSMNRNVAEDLDQIAAQGGQPAENQENGEARDPLDDEDNAGILLNEFFDFLYSVFYGPLVGRILLFLRALGLFAIFLIIFYMMPYFPGHYLLLHHISIVYEIVKFVELRTGMSSPAFIKKILDVERWPTSFWTRIASVLCGYALILTTIYTIYRAKFDSWLKDESKRERLVLLKQIQAISKVLCVQVTLQLGFPIFYGALIHVSLFPLFISGPGWAERTWKIVSSYPFTALFIYWVVGVALTIVSVSFVGCIRKFLRKGVLFFIQDPDSPRFNPIGDTILDSVSYQLRRIVYCLFTHGNMLLCGVAGANLLLKIAVPGFWPFRVGSWPGASIIRIWPAFVSFYAVYKSDLITYAQVAKMLSLAWTSTFLFAGEALDLSSWLFQAPRTLTDEDRTGGGYFVRAPGVDAVYMLSYADSFPAVTEDDQRLDGRPGLQPGEVKEYRIVWRPPHFWLRIYGLLGLLWFRAMRFTLLVTFAPLVVGRYLNENAWNSHFQNDIVLTFAGEACMLPIVGFFLQRFGDRRFTLPPVRYGRKLLLEVFVLGILHDMYLSSKLLCPTPLREAFDICGFPLLRWIVYGTALSYVFRQLKIEKRVRIIVFFVLTLLNISFVDTWARVFLTASSMMFNAYLVDMYYDGRLKTWHQKFEEYVRNNIYLEGHVLQNLDKPVVA